METEISSLGEFGLIHRLTDNIPIKNTSTLTAVGDDCAEIKPEAGREILVSTDMLLEGVHFDLTYVPLKHLGYKSAVVNFSDIYAMGGTPRQLVIGLGISKRFTVEHIEELYAGIRLACDVYGVDLVGGDTTASRAGLVISATIIGDVEEGRAIRRSGAKPTDIICVSGDLGAAYMGLQALEREKAAGAGNPDFVPDFTGKEYLVERQLKPEARKDIVAELREAGIQPTSMIDVSDGLSSELMHICKMSHTGCRVYEDRIPIDYQTAVMAEELNMNLVTAAMNGGEDYELLFTVPLTAHDAVSQLKGVRVIGHITAADQGYILVGRNGEELQLRAQGFNHLS